MTAKRPYLEALGIPLWLPRQTLAVHPQSVDVSPPPAGEKLGERAEESNHPGATRHPSLSEEGNTQDRPWSAMNIDERDLPEPLPPDDWVPDDHWEPVSELDMADFSPPPPALSREVRIAGMDWEELIAEARQCQACGLCTTRTQVVFGVGNRQADWLIIGEGPGADEDQQGEPFVGRAGKLLNPMLLAIGVQREQAYITNIVRCRPPENREPTPEEAAKCRPFLERQMALIRPRIILALGRIAAQNLLNTDTPIGKLRGQVHRFGPSRIPVVVIYHPAYLLRSPREKRKAWDDLRLARRTLAAELADSERRRADP
ncbi:MAG TPA: uracil-DNA glycosylase [Candidatus Competibacteraceae bacterium]|nr:uracil-DNA glycosylase [Candidatus Competibacteraceae bacterium]HRZ06657.1 uracil-DNA glycosylase [Candidatus Competibacteraceae bacterium]HSA45493.1 uracil-DNA glycosylase [Candidatus Competibacteraceae bacterium]